MNDEISTPNGYARLMGSIKSVYDDLFRRLFMQVYKSLNQDLVKSVNSFVGEFMLLLFLQSELGDHAESIQAVTDILLENLDKNRQEAKAQLNNWVDVIVPSYFFGSPENEVVLETAADPSNTTSSERFDSLKQWMADVNAAKFEDNEQARQFLNVVKTHAVTTPESYHEWFDALRSLSKHNLSNWISS